MRFESLAKSIKIRDKALEKFKHYYDKLAKLKQEKSAKGNNFSNKDVDKLARVSFIHKCKLILYRMRGNTK
jgi:hypothetical protein